jgi:hypothetical protein
MPDISIDNSIDNTIIIIISFFSVLAEGHSDLTGIPKSVELSYDWQ